MSINIPRRKFLKTAGVGLLLPAAGRASTTDYLEGGRNEKT